MARRIDKPTHALSYTVNVLDTLGISPSVVHGTVLDGFLFKEERYLAFAFVQALRCNLHLRAYVLL